MSPKSNLTGLLASGATLLLLTSAAQSEPPPVQSVQEAGQRHRVFVMPSDSMLPTLISQDRLLVDTQPKTAWQRGDIVVIKVRQEQWLKRIVGLPGDRIVMRNGQVVLNGKAVSQQFDSEIELPSESGVPAQKASKLSEQFPGEVRPHQILDLGRRSLDDTNEVLLGPNQYFLLGDNRDNSADSRMADQPRLGLGLVDRKQLYGRATYRFWRSANGFDLVALQPQAQ